MMAGETESTVPTENAGTEQVSGADTSVSGAAADSLSQPDSQVSGNESVNPPASTDDAGNENKPASNEELGDREFIPRTAAEEHIRKVQAAKDKELAERDTRIRELEGQLNPTQQLVTNQPAAEGEQFSHDEFLKRLETNSVDAVDYLVNEITGRVTTQQQEVYQQQRAADQYLQQVEQHLSPLAPEDRARAEAAVAEQLQQGRFMPPQDAYMIGRYGSVQNALDFANKYVDAQAAQQAAAPPTHPPVPGGAPVLTPNSAGSADGSPAGNMRGSYRGIL